jgi:hypothetical protein
VFDWFKRSKKQDADRLAAWRKAWQGAIDGTAPAPPEALRAQLDHARVDGEDVEVELEMLDASEALASLERTLAAGELPVVETHHRVIGTEACHFSAPASRPEDTSQASGRLLFTATRATFVGGGRTSATPWHAVHEVLRTERDVLLVRADHTPAAHFRFNTYADAVSATRLAKHLARALRLRSGQAPRPASGQSPTSRL